MSTAATAASAQPYAPLTPDTVLNALESVGLRGDGRLTALNSYENLVYQVWLEEPSSPPSRGSTRSAICRIARWTCLWPSDRSFELDGG